MSESAVQCVQMALSDLHPSWLPQVEHDLLEYAKCSDLGLRWLASQLEFIPLLMVPPAALELSDELMICNTWCCRSLRCEDALFMELGALTCASTIRVAITRDEVLRWRRILGVALYQQCLENAAPGSDHSLQQKREDDLDTRDDASLVNALRKRAYHELLCYASMQHDLLAQRIALAFPESWWRNYQNDRPVRTLTAEMVANVIAQRDHA